ncbi:MAG: D-aminoacyl-tRNA deacylase [Acidobacteriota bacterium]|nr:D-aminoacyl-tRNA deacylase [Acidobacteriota bacterium]
MRIVIQRVKMAKVEIDSITVASIRGGLFVLIGVAKTDTAKDADYLVDKLLRMRIFADGAGKMNRNVAEAEGEILLVPNFTLYGDCRKGRRPHFDLAAPPELARSLYEYFVESVQSKFGHAQSGIFQARMEAQLVNDGPVTLICDS